MRVWIEQDWCTGGGSCDEIAPDVFFKNEDSGLAHVKEDHPDLGERRLFDPAHGLPGGAEGVARVPAGLEDAVTTAIDDCPGMCIMLAED